MHFQKRFKRKKTPAKLYAVCGVERGAGSTNFALALANYLCSKWGYRTAYVELNGTNQIKAYAPSHQSKTFRISGVSIYEDYTLPDLSSLLALATYDCLVIDFGVLTSSTAPEFYRCDKQYVIGSLRTFRLDKYETWVSLYQPLQTKSQDKPIYLGNLSTKKEIRHWESRHHRTIHAVPLIDQPFQIPASLCYFFEEMI